MNKPSNPHLLSYASAVSQTRRVFVRELEVMASIGVYEHEKQYQQQIIISVDLIVQDDYDGRSDDLPDVLDYGQIVEAIHAIIKQGHVNLIETLAERIAQSCLVNNQVYAAKIKIEKPAPFPEARSVGIEIERLRLAD